MDEGSYTFSRKHREALISGITAGFFLIIIGALYFIMPTLLDRTVAFLTSFHLVTIPNIGIPWIAPTDPLGAGNRVVYLAAERFSFLWGVFQIVILVLRLVLRSPVEKISETVSNMVYWFGSGFLIRTFLLETVQFRSVTNPLTRWFVFWAAIIVLFGVALIIRGIIRAAVPMTYVAKTSMQSS